MATPLFNQADDAERGETEMVQLLLRKGADKDAFSSNNSRNRRKMDALSLAVTTIIWTRCRITTRPHRGGPVVFQAVRLGRVEILRAMIEHGADVDSVCLLHSTFFQEKKEATCLHLAAWHNQVEVIDVLVGAGANIQARDTCGHTPLFFAVVTLHDREAV